MRRTRLATDFLVFILYLFAGALRARSRFSVLNPRTGKTKPTRGMAVIAGDLAVIGLAATWLRGRARAAVSSTAGGAACLAQDT
eukprot:m.255765 g.255765  ORF g.255765 m.255765 type:complete len:84 (-) comp15948_c0_seq5:560-811(-)